jgi:chorismate synthase
MGAIIDGCPAGVIFDENLLKQELERRRPGIHQNQTSVVSERKEQDAPEILSGIFEGKTLGTPIAIMIKNHDQKSKDYDQIQTAPRIGHADDVWKSKFGHQDHRGGGRSSGRETVARVIGGAVAKMLIKQCSPQTEITGYVSQFGNIKLNNTDELSTVKEMLLQAQKNGESYGGVATIQIKNPPQNLGQPVFHKLKADLAAAMMSVGAATGFEIGDGFSAAEMQGTKFHTDAKSKSYGGIRGGISTGEEITMRISFKPTSSILDVAKQGRHDPCIVIRALPVLESMAALVIADHILWSKTDRV